MVGNNGFLYAEFAAMSIFSWLYYIAVEYGYKCWDTLWMIMFVYTGQIETEDSCNEYESCDDCIGKGRGCVWCPDPPVSVQHTLSIIP